MSQLNISPKTALFSSYSGSYVSRSSGVAIHDFVLSPGNYIFVPSTFEPIETEYELELYASEGLSSQFIVTQVN